MVDKATIASNRAESSFISNFLGKIAVSFRVEATGASFSGGDDSIPSGTGGAKSIETSGTAKGEVAIASLAAGFGT